MHLIRSYSFSLLCLLMVSYDRVLWCTIAIIHGSSTRGGKSEVNEISKHQQPASHELLYCCCCVPCVRRTSTSYISSRAKIYRVVVRLWWYDMCVAVAAVAPWVLRTSTLLFYYSYHMIRLYPAATINTTSTRHYWSYQRIVSYTQA